MWVMLNYSYALESWGGVFLSYEIVKYGSLKNTEAYQKAFAEMVFFRITSLEYFIPTRHLASAVSTDILSFWRAYLTVFRLMYTADFGNMEQLYLAIQLIVVFS